MKRVIFFVALFSILIMSENAYSEDFYYTGAPQMNYRTGKMVVSLPPPPPMNSVPWYVRDDWDDYVEDYYKCILGYDDYYTMTCRYWRKYAEKNNFYYDAQNQNMPQVNGINMNTQTNGVPQNGQTNQGYNQNGNSVPNQMTPPAAMQTPAQPYNQNGYVAPNGQTPTQNRGYVAPNGQAPNHNNGPIPR